MPTYEFQCNNIDCIYFEKVIETVKKMSDADPVYCENCVEPLEKLLSKSNFVLKGGCWARDGYRSKQ